MSALRSAISREARRLLSPIVAVGSKLLSVAASLSVSHLLAACCRRAPRYAVSATRRRLSLKAAAAGEGGLAV